MMRMNLVATTPRYAHDCAHCKPLGRSGRFDLYVCVGPTYSSYIAREGRDGDYSSVPSDIAERCGTGSTPAGLALKVAIVRHMAGLVS